MVNINQTSRDCGNSFLDEYEESDYTKWGSDTEITNAEWKIILSSQNNLKEIIESVGGLQDFLFSGVTRALRSEKDRKNKLREIQKEVQRELNKIFEEFGEPLYDPDLDTGEA